MSLSQKRINSLDFLRGVASLAVAWFHLCTFHYPSADGRYYHLVKMSGTYGWLGVEVFFVISGFVIPYSLNRAGYQLSSYPRFLLKRIVRLDPPYLVSIVIILLLAYSYAAYSGHAVEVEAQPVGLMRVLLHLGYLNMFFHYAWLNPSFWTLAIEFQYYLMVGLGFPLISSRNRSVRWTVLLLFAGSAFFIISHGLLPDGAPYGPYIFTFAPLFVMGIVTFQKHSSLVGKAEYVTMLAITSAITLFTVGVAATSAGLFAVAAINFYQKRFFVAKFFGDISYSLYLLHWPLGHLTLSLVGSKLLGASTDSARIAVIFFALAVCVVCSYLLYALVERPAQQWSSRIKYGRNQRDKMAEEVSGIAPAGVPAETSKLAV
jgi:peptidoglycan/LPS O-acetylase OafA/YrhL